ncbi:MAG: HepT-like ribonuclease domain-containing protein [Patescibacteria group bacterium]|nr:HepT-like ribonuclease domain-containing protein [Patescibacteria group bacterium]
MIDNNLIKRKVAAIQADLTELAKFKDYSLEQIAGNYRNHKVVERIIEVVVNEAIDINQHIIVNSGYKELPFDFRESFLLLIKLKVYPKSFAQKIANSVGLRNILVHQYRKLDEEIFYASIKDCLRQYSQYCGYILKFIV